MSVGTDHIAGVKGSVLTPGDAEYDSARQIWNGMFDCRPAMIVRCADESDVAAAVRHAADLDMVVSVRGGGHSFAGHSTNDDGLVIDLSAMRGVHVDPVTRTVRAEPGLLQGDLDTATYREGLAVPGGQVSHTGMSGLTLGGGIGWLSRLHGLSCDNLIGADVILASGERRRASLDDDADLFWAIRGGGGNFGVVTSFDFQLHPLGLVVEGMVGYKVEDAAAVASGLAEYRAAAPDAVGLMFSVISEPTGGPTLAMQFCHAHPEQDAGETMRLLSGMGPKPVLSRERLVTYPRMQRLLNDGVEHGRRYYGRSVTVEELSEPVLKSLAESYDKRPGRDSRVGGMMMGGAINRVHPHATAYSLRNGHYLINILGVWDDAAEDDTNIAWVKETQRKLKDHTRVGVYVNKLGNEGTARIRAAYGKENYERLAQLKLTYDPDNLFKMNQNIFPQGTRMEGSA